MLNLTSFGAVLILLLVLGRLTSADDYSVKVPSPSSVCPLRSVQDSIFEPLDPICPLNWINSFHSAGVIEGDEDSLQAVLSIVQKRKDKYAALLFYASWCPFSGTFKPRYSSLASLFPSIPHFAIEESSIRPSILSKYGVHGFPTLILLNSTMRVRYHGSRSLDSLTTFYGDITGFEKASIDEKSLDEIRCLSYDETQNSTDQESCPFTWARSPENLLGQDTYLALATAFVILRLLYIIIPAIWKLSHLEWRRYILNIRLRSLWELPFNFVNRAVQLFNSLKEPCKRRNLQEGAMNAKAWASKSLASVSFGEASSSRVVPVREEIH